MKDKILLPGRPNEATQVLTLQQNGGFVFANNKIESHRRREQVGIVPQVSDPRVCDVEVEIKRPDGAPPSSLRTDC
jgi:hypothetical protein